MINHLFVHLLPPSPRANKYPVCDKYQAMTFIVGLQAEHKDATYTSAHKRNIHFTIHHIQQLDEGITADGLGYCLNYISLFRMFIKLIFFYLEMMRLSLSSEVSIRI